MNKIRLPEASQAPDKKKPPHSENELMIFLKEANQISQGAGDIVDQCTAFYKSKREVVVVDKAQFLQAFTERVTRRFESGHHVQKTLSGQKIVDHNISATTESQVTRLLSINESFRLNSLVEMIYKRDMTWTSNIRHDRSKYSMLVRIWNRELHFNTPELNELCELIRTHMSSDKKKWLTRLVDLSIATRTQLNSDR